MFCTIKKASVCQQTDQKTSTYDFRSRTTILPDPPAVMASATNLLPLLLLPLLVPGELTFTFDLDTSSEHLTVTSARYT